MTVYFVARRDDPRMIKIGVSRELGRRLKVISCSAPIVLIATCDGDKVEERYFQKRFMHLRTEGEWFKADDAMMKFIAENATACHVEYGKADVRWHLRKPANRKEMDGLIAHVLIKQFVNGLHRTTTLAEALEEIYVRLSQFGDGWTRRRVRSLYEQTAYRVDVYEITDLLIFAGIPDADWPSWLRGEQHIKLAEIAA